MKAASPSHAASPTSPKLVDFNHPSGKVKRQAADELRADIALDHPWLSGQDDARGIEFILTGVTKAVRIEWRNNKAYLGDDVHGNVANHVFCKRRGRKPELISRGPHGGHPGEEFTAYTGDQLVMIAGHKVSALPKEEIDRLCSTTGFERHIGVKRQMVSSKGMEAYLIQQREILENCSALPFTVALFLIFVWLTMLHGQTESTFQVTSSLNDDIGDITVLAAGSDRRISLHDHDVPAELMMWLGVGVVDQACTKFGLLDPTDPQYVLLDKDALPPGRFRSFNQVIGGIRVQQRRSVLGDCVQDLTESHGARCYGRIDDIADLEFDPIEDTVFIDSSVARERLSDQMRELREVGWM